MSCKRGFLLTTNNDDNLWIPLGDVVREAQLRAGGGATTLF